MPKWNLRLARTRVHLVMVILLLVAHRRRPVRQAPAYGHFGDVAVATRRLLLVIRGAARLRVLHGGRLRAAAVRPPRVVDVLVERRCVPCCVTRIFTICSKEFE